MVEEKQRKLQNTVLQRYLTGICHRVIKIIHQSQLNWIFQTWNSDLFLSRYFYMIYLQSNNNLNNYTQLISAHTQKSKQIKSHYENFHSMKQDTPQLMITMLLKFLDARQ